MKSGIKSLFLLLMVSFWLSFGVYAQEPEALLDESPADTEISGLSVQQKEMLKMRREKNRDYMKDLRGSISKEQWDILDDPRVMPEDRQRQFRASLTDSQVQMITSHKREMRSMREEFRATLTPAQKMAMKNAIVDKRQRKGNAKPGGKRGQGIPN